MYSATQTPFDINAAFSGGGYMPSQSTQITESGSSSANDRDKGLAPLTVKQITSALITSEDKSNFLVDGVAVKNVTLVGLVSNKEEKVTEITFTLDDGTGKMDCQRWMNESIDTREMSEVQVGMYVRVHGHLKAFQGKKHMVVFSVRPVTDFNEIAHHFLGCMYVHCLNTKSQDGIRAQPQTINSTVTSGSMGYQNDALNQISGLSRIDHMIVECLNLPANIGGSAGVHIDDLAKQLKLPVATLMDSIKALEDEGTVYTTIDDFHYKTTKNF